MRRGLWIIAGGTAVVFLLVGGYLLSRGPERSPREPSERAATPSKPIVPEFWIPREADFVLRLTPNEKNARSLGRLVAAAPPGVQPGVGSFLKEFGLKQDSVDYFTVASLGGFPTRDRAVITIVLKKGHDASILETTSEGIQADWAGLKWYRRQPGGKPFAVLDERTFVTGPDALLASIAEHGGNVDGGDGDGIRLLLKPETGEGRPTGLFIRAKAWQEGAVPAVSAWFGVWPKAAAAWKIAGSRTEEFVWLADDEGQRSRIGAYAGNAEAAEKLAGAWTELWSSLVGELAADLESEPSALLSKAGAAIRGVQPRVEGSCVWMEIATDGPLLAILADVAGDERSLRRLRLAAGKRAAEGKQAALSAGLKAFLDKEGRFPGAVAGEGLLPPTTRLSWIASLLPYYGHPDWLGKLDFGYGWKDSRNADVAKRPLEAVINPVLGPQSDSEGFPVTHFVGVAGIGPDAADLPADDPRAGVFGNDRRISLEEIEDGASNTLAILGVVEGLGPWAAGGGGTVRGITRRPIVNGPDGFGSGLPDGMIAGMADGSVRFLSRDIDPRVLEQMATIRGGASEPAQPDEAAQPAEAVAVEEPKQPAAESQQPEVDQRQESANAEVKIRLAERIPRFVFREKPLEAVLEAVGQLGNISLRVDEEAIAQKGISLKTTVTVDRADASLDDILKDALSKTKLAYRIEKGGVWIFPAQ